MKNQRVTVETERKKTTSDMPQYQDPPQASKLPWIVACIAVIALACVMFWPKQKSDQSVGKGVSDASTVASQPAAPGFNNQSYPDVQTLKNGQLYMPAHTEMGPMATSQRAPEAQNIVWINHTTAKGSIYKGVGAKNMNELIYKVEHNQVITPEDVVWKNVCGETGSPCDANPFTMTPGGNLFEIYRFGNGKPEVFRFAKDGANRKWNIDWDGENYSIKGPGFSS